MNKQYPQRPITGGTNQGIRPRRYAYWRVGYGDRESFPLDFWVERAGEFHCKPGYVTGGFDHPDSTQLFYHLAGEATFRVNGQETAVHRGDLLIIPPNSGSSCRYAGALGLKYHWLGLSGEWPPILGRQPIPRRHSPGHDAELEAHFRDIRELLILRQPGYPLRAVGQLYELIARLEALLQPPRLPESTYPEAVRNAIIYLRENYRSPFDAAATATAVSLSQSHLRALFEKWVGESPHQFHTRCRIDQARRLLTEQRLPVSQVALLVGFKDGRYFSRVFKRFTGITPSQYDK